MELGLARKRALVMGGTSGIGFSIAKALLAEGAQVAICGKNEVKLEKAAKELKAHFAVPCDLNLPSAGKELTQKVIAKMGGIDILICNTGGPRKATFEETNEQDWLQGFRGLWMSTVDSIQGALPGMRAAHWGRILLITSVAAKEPMPSLTISNGLRAGLLGLTKSMSNEIAADGITINALLPGFTRTDRLKELNLPEEKMTAQVPARRLGEPEEIAALATFLASTQAGYVTGQTIACDGGYLKGI